MSKNLRLQVVLSALDKVSGPLRRIRDGAGGTGQELKVLRDRLKGLEGQQKTIGEFRQLSRGLNETRSAMGQAQERVRSLAQEMRSTETPTAAMRREFNAAVRTSKNLSQQHDQQRLKLNEVRTALGSAGISTRNLGQSERQLRSDITSTNQQIEAQRQQLARLAEQTRKVGAAREKMERTRAFAGRLAIAGAASSAAGYGILRGGSGLLRDGIEFDTGMSKVQALTRLDGDSEQLQQLREQARELGATTMFTAMEALSGQSFLAMAGFTPQAILDAMPGVLDLAKAGDTDIGQTADIASNILSGFNLEATEMARVGDVLTNAFTRSNTTLESLGETMKYAAPNAAAFGQDIESIAAAAGILGSSAMGGSMGGTAMRAILSRLAAPPKAAASALEELGIEVSDAQGNMRDFPELLQEIYERTKDLGNAHRGGLLKDIAGQEAGSALTVLVNAAGTGSLQEFVKSNREAQNESARTSKVMGDNLAGDLDQLASAWADIKLTISETISGPLRELTQTLTGIIGKVGAWAKRNPELVGTLVKMAGIVGVLAAGFGAVSMAIAAVLVPFASLRFATTVLGIRMGGLFRMLRTALPVVLGVIRSVGVALMANPVLAAIAAIAAAAMLIYIYWEPIKEWFGRLWSAVKEAFDGGILSVSRLLFDWSPAGLIYNNWSPITGWFSSAWSSVKESFSEHTSSIARLLFDWSPAGLVYNNWSAISEWFGGVWESIKGAFDGGIANVATLLLNWSPMGLVYRVIMTGLNSLGAELPERFSEFGSMLMQGLVNGIKNMAGSVKDSIVGMGSNVVGWFKDKLDIRSPSRVFIGFGENISEGAGLGIQRGERMAMQSLRHLTAAIAAAGVMAPVGASASQQTDDRLFDMPRLTIDTRAPVSAVRRAAPAAIQGDTIEINIHPVPGMDPQAIARAVREELDRRDRERGARARSAMSDYGY